MAETMLYRYDGFPGGLIGPAQIIWKPSGTGNAHRRLWIRLHPSIFQETWDTVKMGIHELTRTKGIEPGSSSSPLTTDGLQMRDLRGDLDALEIIGPSAGHVLGRILRPCKDQPPIKSQVGSSSLKSSAKEPSVSQKSSFTIQPNGYTRQYDSGS